MSAAPHFQAWVNKAKETNRIVRARNIKLVGRALELAGPCPQCGCRTLGQAMTRLHFKGIDRLANHRQSIPRLLDEAADRPQLADRAFHYEVRA